MAKQKSILPIEGTIGNLTFYKNDGEFNVRQKSSLDADRIANDPRFERTRENGHEFARAGRGAKVIRAAFNNTLQRIGDKRVTARLVQRMHKVLKSDMDSLRGQRTVEAGNVLFLKGFEFNNASTLGSTITAPYMAFIDRVEGTANVDIPALIPTRDISRPKGATHYIITATAAEVDFGQDTFVQSSAETGELPFTEDEQAPITLTVQLTPNSTKHIFVVLSIEFFQQLNNRYYHLSNGSHSAMQMVEVNQAA